MKPELVVVGPLLPALMETLDRDYVTHRLWEVPDRDALLAEVGPRVRAIATSGHHGATAALMDALPNLEIIGCFGVGVDAIDIGHAKARGVIVTNTPDVLTDDVADLAVGLLLAVARGIVAGDRHVRSGKWLQGPMPLMRKVSSGLVGIAGLGRIGRAIAKRVDALGARIAYYGRRSYADVDYPFYGDLVSLARDCDYLILATPGGADTHHMVDRAVIDALGPAGALINIGRGSLVDEAALVDALVAGRLGGAGLDVFEDEPRVPQALFALDNVVLQPHVGSATVETRQAMGDLVAANLRAHFAGRPPITPFF
ncbi:MAG: 2-hydroxyacid dehydrogenase [Rhodospirillaceae bacterium]|nr:2-hydroxyacid dehydrogenase [Rhodospirillaceae bacterium]